MKHVYLILEETDIYGAWSGPREAAKRYLGYRKEPDPDIDAESLIQAEVTKELEELMDTTDYPVLCKVPVDPTTEMWTLDR